MVAYVKPPNKVNYLVKVLLPNGEVKEYLFKCESIAEAKQNAGAYSGGKVLCVERAPKFEFISRHMV